ncbi:MAG: hypothetical protein P8L20_09710 [Flavobacteriales bacterium]|nr:hypothetical protein [Flavobacteriales bacterium]
MKKYGLIISLIILLSVLAWYMSFLGEQESDASSEAFSEFAVADTSLIETFVISDTENNSITITRKKDGKTWMIGDSEYKALPSSVDLITNTFQRIRVKQDVPEIAVENILTLLAVRHKKVEIFLKGEEKPHKTWFIGSATNDHTGTYMLLKIGDTKSDVPYITYKQDMVGSLDVRFHTTFQDWRFTGVFNYPPNSIKKIAVKFNQKIEDSYTIDVLGENTVALYNHQMQPLPVFDSSQVKHYLSHYKKIHYNDVNRELTQGQVDSVFALVPHYEISVTDKNGKLNEVQVWKMKKKDASSETNNQIVWNPEKAWCRINGTNEIFKVQYFSWDVLLKPLSYYKKK